MEESVIEAVKTLNCDLLLELLPDCSSQPRLSPKFMCSVFFIATDSLIKFSASGIKGARIVYLLRNLGAPINIQNENGDTAIMCYLRAGKLDCDILEAFLRCNADLYISNKQGEFPLELVTSHHVPDAVRDVCLRYMPGIWEAVAQDDAMSVRKLINEWCRVDIQKNDKTLLQLALENGTENIIRVVSGIRPSMDFAHSVLAGDTELVRRMLRLKLKINVNFRNLGDYGKTPIFYALLLGNTDMVHALFDRGARVDITLRGENELDIPLFFTALELKPVIDISLLKDVIPVFPVRIDALFYKGQNVLFHCIEKDVGEELVDIILKKSSSYLVTQRVERNLCARDMAEERGCTWMIKAIDAAVVRWVYQEEGLNRQILILQGYKHIPAALQSISSEECKPDTFYRCLSLYQEQVNALHKAVEECDEETVRRTIYFLHPDGHSLDPCLADSRRPGYGQPLLHKAVLRGSVSVAQLLAQTLVYQQKQSLDSVRDQFFRTALHYAYALEDGKDLVNLLLDYGASEFTMDKDNRSPLAFKDRRGQDLMNALLCYQHEQDLSQPEPNPWTVALSIPIIDCLSVPQQDEQRRAGEHVTGNASFMQQLSPLPNIKLTVTELSHHNSQFDKSHKYKSISDTKLHRLSSDKQGLAARFSDVVSSKCIKHPHHSTADEIHKNYLPVPVDVPGDSDDEHSYEDDSDADSTDLLDEKEERKTMSCSVQ